ncbi:MAG: NAD-dependent protein deacylase [Lachnospiraceae bacterium]|nr:NAD-dependent protein deacylase [Lachnospiraceae bacterium]
MSKSQASLDDSILELNRIINKYDNIVFFGGAGVSTESGIPDFRSVDGIYHQQYDYPPETILSHSFYRAKTAEFYRFYRNKMLFLDVAPNVAHLKLAELEAAGKLRAVITQNIDGLHQAAGSKTVLELHGSVLRNYCEHCGEFHDVEYILRSEDIPKCNKCGGPVKPDVVLYEEGLDDKTIRASIQYIRNAQVLIIGGTSLAVYPAAGLIDYFQGDKLIVINKSATPRDNFADLLIQAPIGEVFAKIKLQNLKI